MSLGYNPELRAVVDRVASNKIRYIGTLLAKRKYKLAILIMMVHTTTAGGSAVRLTLH